MKLSLSNCENAKANKKLVLNSILIGRIEGSFHYRKTGKQVLIAVMNKLLKKVFAVVKYGTIYQTNYCSIKP